MIWRLYDTINSRWYNDDVYNSREVCVVVGDHYMQEARSEGEVLALVAEPLDPSEAAENLGEEEEEVS